MVTITNDWLELLSDIALGKSDDEISAVAVGIGTGNEGQGANALANEVYRSNKDNADVSFEETGTTGQFRARLEVTAGGSTANVETSNPDENDITEIGIFTEQGQLVVIDEFSSAIEIPAGHTEEFTIDANYTR
jgi:hypothetical protein